MSLHERYYGRKADPLAGTPDGLAGEVQDIPEIAVSYAKGWYVIRHKDVSYMVMSYIQAKGVIDDIFKGYGHVE